MRYPIFAEQKALVESCKTTEERLTVQTYLDELEGRCSDMFDFIDYLGKGNDPSVKAIDQAVKNMEIIMSLCDIIKHVMDEQL